MLSKLVGSSVDKTESGLTFHCQVHEEDEQESNVGLTNVSSLTEKAMRKHYLQKRLYGFVSKTYAYNIFATAK